MLQCWRALAIPLLVSIASAFAASSQSFENSAIVRTVDLGGSLVHVTTTFAARALEPNANAYTITLTEEEIHRTSWLEVKVKGQQQPLTVTYGGGLPDSKFYNLDVQLPSPLELNSTVNIVLETIQTHATYPWPERATQQDEQALKHNTTLFVLSPYKTNVQRTKVKTPSPEVRSYTTPKDVDAFTLESPVTKSGATITYGPFNNLPVSASNEWIAKNQQLISMHYKYDYPVLELTKVKRAAEISHWGANLNIQDDIVLYNAGPELKGHFSRLEHQTQSFYKRSAAHVIPSLSIHLPAGIHDVYYYDLVGNVSTSRLRTAPSVPKNSKSNQYSVMELRPRYPLLGGWNYSFTLGWDSPLEDSASYDQTTGKYIVQVPIMTDLPGSVTNDCEVKIILPEGATDVEYVLPFPAISTEESTHVTYLDTLGRPAITFKYKNLTTKHAKSIYVSYKVPFSVHFRKPIAVATALLSLFVFGMVARRVDLTLQKKTA
ncbi:dolichyl-diphosphooligosaccharide--protein glycosyltransferase subunit 1 [Stygiomarasmius scandens]|uniref:Dolichyl-diphosphooligosaccharide--protein glycosyltransferase subunit 1 n=1 Tax=Marasmiellus scandens TaxID=2682957 RepID=A0ABR1K712_9AGAR